MSGFFKFIEAIIIKRIPFSVLARLSAWIYLSAFIKDKDREGYTRCREKQGQILLDKEAESRV
jgi:hypothetical protein